MMVIQKTNFLRNSKVYFKLNHRLVRSWSLLFESSHAEQNDHRKSHKSKNSHLRDFSPSGVMFAVGQRSVTGRLRLKDQKRFGGSTRVVLHLETHEYVLGYASGPLGHVMYRKKRQYRQLAGMVIKGWIMTHTLAH